MRILFCSQNPLLKELGATKILIELVEELKILGWTCKIATPLEIRPEQNYEKRFNPILFAVSLKDYLLKYASEYDVVEYDHLYLPYPRTEFCPKTLFVVREALLTHHLMDLSIPLVKNYKSKLQALIMRRFDKSFHDKIMQLIHITLSQTDLINVPNYDDKEELIRCGYPQEKIVVIPYGMSRSNRLIFDSISSDVPEKPEVVFVGTFYKRKGSEDFPDILENIYNNIPEVKFKLLGTGVNKRDVLAKFPSRIRNSIEIIPNFPSDELPGLLSDCSIGIFPSYAEGFGFGVLEMLSASIPVIAYDVPGPPMMLPPEYLVPRGDTKNISLKVIELLKDKTKLKLARIWAKEKSQQFSWQQIAQETSRIYLERWEKIQTSNI